MAIEIKNLQGKVLHVFEGDTLVGADLHGLDLRGANFSGAWLQKANLSGANLAASAFFKAKLTEANLAKANLVKVDFRGLILPSVNLVGANLAGANLEGVGLLKSNLQQASLVGAWLRKTKFEGVNLQGADFQGAYLQFASFRYADLSGADFTGAMAINSANFTGAKNMDKAIGLNVGKQASQLEQEWGPTLKTATLTLDGIRQAVLLEEQELCKQFRDEVVKYLLRYAPKLSWGTQPKTHWDAVRGTFSISGILPEPNKDLRDLRVIWLVPKVFYRFNAKGDTRIAVVGEDGNGEYIDVSFDSTVPAVGQRLLKAIQKMLERDE